MSKKRIPFLFLFVCCLIAGCSNGMVAVSGKVTFEDGSPVTRGVVMFNDGLHSATGTIQPDGSYILGALEEAGGIHPGDYAVAVQKNWDDPVDENGKGPDTFEVAVKFRTGADSGLKCTVEPGKSKVFDFTVERKK
jgi:hypothetical protein